MKNSTFKSHALPPMIGTGIALVVSFVFVLSIINHFVVDQREYRISLEQKTSDLEEQRDNLKESNKLLLKERTRDHIEAEWLARMLISETNREHEMLYVAWVARNRVESPYFPNTYQRVVRYPYAFSAFNYNMPYNTYFSTLLFDATENDRLMNRLRYTTHELRMHALDIAYSVMHSPEKNRPFSAHVTHFYSPVSMSGGLDHRPSWARVYNEVDVPFVEPKRFRFFESRTPNEMYLVDSR